jgi:hypothetical protein
LFTREDNSKTRVYSYSKELKYNDGMNIYGDFVPNSNPYSNIYIVKDADGKLTTAYISKNKDNKYNFLVGEKLKEFTKYGFKHNMTMHLSSTDDEGNTKIISEVLANATKWEPYKPYKEKTE